MKKSLFLTLIFCVVSLIAQEKADRFTSGSNNQTRDPRMDQMNYVPNEILVKFKDETSISAASKIKAAGISNVDQVLQKYEITSLERLFPGEKKPTRSKVMRAPNGAELKVPALDKIYRVTVPNTETPLAHPVNIHQIIEELKALPEIEYAEPNYIYTIGQTQPIGPELTADDLARMQSRQQNANGSAVVPNDPLYPQQWYIPAVKADLVWEQTTGDTTQVIAILDTGVDWTHPDLTNKIWRNWGEIPDNGIDDDGNGLVDDYMGWDYINNDNNPMDDNSHGTHVAGIAAAEANNGIGIAGVNWQAKVMPIKVFNASGRGDVIAISQSILYASQMGATVLNMSWGSYAYSRTLENALLYTYPKCIHVAAAGNDGLSIYEYSKMGHLATFYPAAFNFVFGVQVDAFFSNYDPDGPIFSQYSNKLNYESKLPGVMILSTIPNGNYRQMGGTSMGSPILAASIALYKSYYPNNTLEELWSDFIQINETVMDVNYALFELNKPPCLLITEFEILDRNEGCNMDNIADGGEIVDLLIHVKNTGYPIKNLRSEIKLSNDGNPNDINILVDSVFFGDIGVYRTIVNDSFPFKILINKSSQHYSTVSLDVVIYSESDTLIAKQNIKFKIFNGEELPGGIVDSIITINSTKNWIVKKPLKFTSTGGLVILPGAHLYMYESLVGDIKAYGTKDSMINLSGVKDASISGKVFKYCNFINIYDISGDILFSEVNSIYGRVVSDSIKFSKFRNCTESTTFLNADYVENSFFENIYAFTFPITSKNSPFGEGSANISLINNTFINFNSTLYPSAIPKVLKFNNFVNATGGGAIAGGGGFFNIGFTYDQNNTSIRSQNTENNIVNCPNFFRSYSGTQIIKWDSLYWGTTNPIKINNMVVDFWDDINLSMVDFKNMLTSPSSNAHAMVWKILVNGKDAQDEYVEPVGVGQHRFDVYFNRPMNKAIKPQVTFGGIYPYTSIPVNEDGTWSEDGKIYTVYKTIKLTTGDGINRIRVAGAKEIDGWDFEIPVEDSRFEFVIAAASSSSIDFMATPGLGKVALEWNHNDLEDGLGYNMYRMEHINDSTLTQPVIINSSLITDTLYTDFSVAPNKKYYYYYKILRTNMAETDSSRVVSAIPFTASKGDANGDLSVNVLDITTIVAHLLNNNPQPFIQEAADVNSDEQINVLDIVGVVNLVLGVPQHAPGIAMNKQVDLYMQNDTLFADSNVDIGAIQFDLAGIAQFSELEVLDALKAFESGNSYVNGSLRVIFYSMSGKSIEPGQAIPLLKLKSGSMINDAIIGEPNGSSVKVNYIKTRIPDISANMNQTIAELGQNYPNPANIYTTIPVRIYEPVDELVLRITNMLGQEVEEIRLSNPVTGENLINWNPKHHKGLLMYKLEIRQGNNRSVCPAKRMMVR